MFYEKYMATHHAKPVNFSGAIKELEPRSLSDDVKDLLFYGASASARINHLANVQKEIVGIGNYPTIRGNNAILRQ